jgi:hypothetical protein
MRLLFLALVIFLVSCESRVADKDNRQIAAKNEMRRKLPAKATAFDITGFREDTITNYTDTLFKKPLCYTLDFEYKDSTGNKQEKTGSIFFTPDGKSIINSEVRDRER